MNNFVELFLLDGAESLLLGYAEPSEVSVGDVVDVDGEFFEVSKKFPLYIELYSDELAFFTEMYGGISGRDIYHIETYYCKQTIKEGNSNERNQD